MGKSNISDSILFVLGPPSSKALRADRLTRLFFNGGKQGKPATECEVSLIFDNSDRAMAVDSDEVELTRYVKVAPGDPDGYYSYFYVNGRRSTQTEMDSLLARARLSAEGYNVIQQGEVNRIIVMSPLERRGLAERLAGIAQYDEDLSKAADKRTAVETNMSQLGTILGEVERNLAQLDGQRTQAIRYRDLSTAKHQLEVAMARTNINKLRSEVASAEKQQTQLTADLEKLASKLAELRSRKTATEAQIRELEGQIAQRAGAEALKVQEEKDRRKLEVGRQEMALTNTQAAFNEATESKAQVEHELATRRKDLKALEERTRRLEVEVATIQKQVTEHQQTLTSAHESKELSQKAVELKRSQLVNERDQAARGDAWQKAVQKAETAKAELASLEQNKALLEEELGTRQAEVKDAEFRIKNTSSSRKGGESSIQSLTDEMHSLKAKEKNLSAASERLKIETLELNRSYAGLEAKLKERGGGGGPGMAADFLLSQHNLGRLPGIRGKVEDLVTVDPELTTAISVAGGSRLQALVVDNDEVAAQCIDLLNKEKRGRVTLLPLNKMVPGRPRGKALVVQHSPGCRGFALDLVKFDKSFEDALWFVFGETLIMDNLDAARKQMGGVRLVTLRGELLEATGAITGGFLGGSSASRMAENAATLKHLAEQLGSRTAEEGRVNSELQTVTQRLKVVTEELARHSGEVTGAQSAMDQLQKDLTSARERLRDTEERSRKATARYTELSQEFEGLSRQAESVQKELSALKAAHEEIQKQFIDFLPASLGARMKKLQEEGQQLNDTHVAKVRDLESARSTLTASTETLRSREAELERLKTLVATKDAEVKKITKALAEEREKLATVEKVVESQNQVSRTLTVKKDGLQVEFNKVTADEASTATKLQTQEGLAKDFQIRLDTQRAALQEAESAVHDLPELPKELQGKSLEELRKAMVEATNALEALGSVNTLAIDQYDSEKKRLDEFQGEVTRLKEEREGLLALVKELEEKKRSRLGEVIGGIDENYRKIYTELSGGGEGELVMENPNDPLAGGLLLRARPLGKKADRLEQLSGGEKSLASLAFIFALQRYDPSPLYVLDEVDMSLDGVNAENIGRMFRRNSAKAQFIVISLRKVTLKWSEHLFGVTMRGDGRSQVVGLRLDDIKDIDERELSEMASQPNNVAKADGGS